jgi:hypothetical protein
MGHRDNCPDDYEARSQARRDADRDIDYGYRSYRSPYDCDHANEEYRRSYGAEFDAREEELRMERAAARRREEQQAEEQYYAECAYRAEEDRHWDEQAELASLEAMAAEQPTAEPSTPTEPK